MRLDIYHYTEDGWNGNRYLFTDRTTNQCTHFMYSREISDRLNLQALRTELSRELSKPIDLVFANTKIVRKYSPTQLLVPHPLPKTVWIHSNYPYTLSDVLHFLPPVYDINDSSFEVRPLDNMTVYIVSPVDLSAKIPDN